MAPNFRLYTPEIAETILEQIADGIGLRKICEAQGMPSRGAVQHWIINDHNGFAVRYARARDAALMLMADDVVELADRAIDSDSAAAARVQVDARKWVLSKLVPKTFGDRIEVNHKTEIAQLPDESIQARLTALLTAPPVIPLTIEGHVEQEAETNTEENPE